MSRRPVIGVTTSANGGHVMWWFYWLSLRLAGIRPVRLMARGDETIVPELDGLVIGGGDNIGTEIYQGRPALDVRIDPDRDRLEIEALGKARGRDIPVFGVCRGAQMLNVFHGGSLHQDIYSEFDSLPHLWTPLPRKRVDLDPGTRVEAVMGTSRFQANSLHRQAVDRLGDGLVISGVDEYGIIQAIEDPRAPFRIGVQWHPEFMIYRRPQRRLFSAFADAVRERVRRH